MTWDNLDFRPSPRKLRQFAALMVLLLVVLAFMKSSESLQRSVVALWAAAFVLASFGVVMPRTIRWLYVGWMTVVWPIGWLISNVVLAFIYFGIVTPLGIVFRLAGRNVLGLGCSRATTSYWSETLCARDAQGYLRQF